MVHLMTQSAVWSRWDKAALLGVIATVFFLMLQDSIGRAEGHIWPVTVGTQIEQTETDGPFATRVWGSFEIVRPECSFRKIEWLLVGLSRDVPISIVYEAGPKVRPGGINGFGPWLLDLSPEQLKQTRATVFHQCKWRPWLTETLFYEGEQ
jgi:hypothetical protein